MLEKLLRLAKEEGGKVFFIDKETEEVYCLLTLDGYEQLKNRRVVNGRENQETELKTPYADLSEEELLDKMQKEIAAWRNRQTEKSDQSIPPAMTTKPRAASETKIQDKTLEDEEHFFLEMA